MPNHVTNVIKISGDRFRVQEMLEKIQNDEFGIGSIDFNKILPMPESMDVEASSRTRHGLEIYGDFIDVYLLGTEQKDEEEALDNIPEESENAFLRQRPDIDKTEWELGKKAWHNIRNYGVPTWYEWANRSWGTKWNAYDFDEDHPQYDPDDGIRFQTAWAAPHPVMERLSEMYPDIEMVHCWADEDIGNNCGSFTYYGGDRTEEYFPQNEAEAINFAADIMDSNPSDWGLVLNAKGTDYISGWDEKYQLAEMLGQTVLYTKERLTDSDIPQGMHCYHLRLKEDGEHYASLEPIVSVNFGGTIMTSEEIDFGSKGYLELTEQMHPVFFDDQKITFIDFIDHEYETETQNMGGMV